MVSTAPVRGLGLPGVSEGDTAQQTQSIAAMCFSLLTNAEEASGTSVEAASVDSMEDVIQRLEASGVELGHAERDNTPNRAALARADVGDTQLHFFQHAAFPFAVAVAIEPDTDARADLLAESLCKRFAHAHGPTYFEASARGVAKPFKKVFSAQIEFAVAEMCGAHLLVLSRANRITEAALAPPGHFLALVADKPGDGRWFISGEVAQGGRDFCMTFAPLELAPDMMTRRVEAFDKFRSDSTAAAVSAPGAAGEEPRHIAVEVNAGHSESFSALHMPELGCYALSTLRLAALRDALCHNERPSRDARQLRAAVHALTKVRTSMDRVTHRVPLPTASTV